MSTTNSIYTIYNITENEISNILSDLQRVYRFRLNLEYLPSAFEEKFYVAAKRFSPIGISSSKMGIVEEVGDLLYQFFKLICVKNEILTVKNQSKLYDEYRQSIFENSTTSKKMLSVDINTIYKTANKFVDSEQVNKFLDFIPTKYFSNQKKIAKYFLSAQYASYLSRAIRNPNETGGTFHSVDFIAKRKIPEETQELIEVLNKQTNDKKKEDLLEFVKQNVVLSYRLVYLIDEFVNNSDSSKDNVSYDKLFSFLDDLVKEKINKDMSLENIIDFCLLKIKGRQELSFKGIDHRTVMHICKPAEYLMEANLVY
jgi:hypothetical protein